MDHRNLTTPTQPDQRGFTLLEILAAMAIGILMLVGLTNMVDMSLQDAKGQQAAQYQAQVTAAAARYMSDHYATLLTGTSGGATVAVTLADLQAAGAGYLPSSFAASNAYRQQPCVLVRSPAANQLDALVVTEGGDPVPTKDIGYVATNAGTGGGAIEYQTPASPAPPIARGAYGSWMLDNPGLIAFTNTSCSGTNATLGNLASALFYGASGTLANDFLYRNAVPGQPTLSSMNVPLGFAGAAVVTAGSACTGPAIGVNAAGRLLNCDASNSWADVSTWRAPVASYAALPAAGDAAGDVRVTLDKGRAYMFSGSSWIALAVDELGNLPMEGALTAGFVHSTSDLKADVNVRALNDVLAARHVNAVADIKAGNNLQAGNDVSAGNNANVTNSVFAKDLVASEYSGSPTYEPTGGNHAAGDPCNFPAGPIIMFPGGTLARDGNGITLFCRAVSGSGIPGIFVYENNTLVPP